MNNRRKKERAGFILACILPAIILFLTFLIYPTIEVFRMSMYRWGGFSKNKQFVGFDNFVTLWKDENFSRTIQNTILLIVIVTIVTVVLAVLFASILTTEKIRGVVIYSLAFALIWQAIGYYMVMYMAGMANIPSSLYEAADLDGAGKIGKFFNVTLPLIWNSIRTTLTFFIISTINLSFLLVQILTNGGPDGSTEVFLSYMFTQAYTNSSFGYGMAIGVVVFIFSFGLSGIVSHITKRDILEY